MNYYEVILRVQTTGKQARLGWDCHEITRTVQAAGHREAASIAEADHPGSCTLSTRRLN